MRHAASAQQGAGIQCGVNNFLLLVCDLRNCLLGGGPGCQSYCPKKYLGGHSGREWGKGRGGGGERLLISANS